MQEVPSATLDSPGCEARLGSERFEHGEGAEVAALFSQQRSVAELAARGFAGLFGRQPLALVALGEEVDVGSDLFVEGILGTRPSEQLS